MTLPKLDPHVIGVIGGVVLCAVAITEALLFHRQSGLNEFDKGLIGLGVTALVGGASYLAGLKTPAP